MNWPTKRDSKADVSSVSPSLDSLRRRANARNVSFQISLRWPIHIINPDDKTKLPYDYFNHILNNYRMRFL